MVTILPLHTRPPQRKVPISLQFLQWKNEPMGTNSNPLKVVSCFARDPSLTLHHRNCRGNLWGSVTGHLMVKQEATCSIQYRDLGRLSLYLRYPSSNINEWLCSLVHSSWGCTLSRELTAQCRSSSFGSSNKCCHP